MVVWARRDSWVLGTEDLSRQDIEKMYNKIVPIELVELPISSPDKLRRADVTDSVYLEYGSGRILLNTLFVNHAIRRFSSTMTHLFFKVILAPY
jgi:hypothetical protein